jgi:hypothetical protein
MFVKSFRQGVKVLDLSEECRQLVVLFISDFDKKQKNPGLILEGLHTSLEMIDKKEKSYLALEKEIRNFSLNEGYLFVIGDSVKKQSLTEGVVSPLGFLNNLKLWVQSLLEIVKAWKDKSKRPEQLEKELKTLDHTRLNKWFSAKRCQDQLLAYIKNS